MVERGGLENHCRRCLPGVRIPPPPQMRFSVIASCLILLVVVPSVSGQWIAYEPVIRPLGSRYQVHRTQHFEIIFEEGAAAEAWETAVVLERMLPEAQALSGAARTMWMSVILNNANDRSNGYVHTHPFRQEIEVPHIKGGRLGPNFSSWIEAVATHELVHASQGQAGGPWGLGKLVHWFAPDAARTFNLSLPPGLNEGAAVYLESQGGHRTGRLNDARFQMQYRAAMASERPWSLSQLFETPRYAFHGNRHYIGGANFYAWQADRDGGSFFKKMRTRRYRNPIRSTGLGLRRATGQSLRELSAEFKQETVSTTRQSTKPASIIAGQKGVLQRWPQWLNDSTLVVYRRGLSETPGLYRLDIKTGQSQLIHPVLLPEDAWFSVKDSVLMYARYVPDRFSTLRSVADVFAYDLRIGSETRVTHGARVHMPLQTSAGIWALQNDGQRNKWVQIDEDGNIQTIRGRSQADLIQIAHTGNKTALLVRHHNTQLVYLAAPDGMLTPLISLDGGAVREISWSSDGRYLLFTADRDGVTDVYCYDLQSEQTRRLTEVSFGAMDPLLSTDGRTLIYVDYQHERYDVVATAFSPSDEPLMSLTPVNQLPDIAARSHPPDEFTYQPYRLDGRLWPRMILPVGSWSFQAPESSLGLRGGLAAYGSDPLRRVTYTAEFTLQSNQAWHRAVISSAFGPVLATLEAYNEPRAVIARIVAQDQTFQDRTYGEQSLGTGVKITLPLRFESNVRTSYARIFAGVRTERTRWFSLDETPVPYLLNTDRSLAEWSGRTTADAGFWFAAGIQKNTRDVWPNRGATLGVYGRADLDIDNVSRRVGMYLRFSQYWSPNRRWNTGTTFGAGVLVQNEASVYSNSLILPRGREAYLGRGIHGKIDIEVLQPVWYPENGLLSIPVYINTVYLYGFAEYVLMSEDYSGGWAAGLGLGSQFRIFHYLDLEVRIAINPLELSQRYFTLM